METYRITYTNRGLQDDIFIDACNMIEAIGKSFNSFHYHEIISIVKQ